MLDVWPAMYSALARPSSMRAAPAKKRIWSTPGGISSLIVSASGLPVFSDSMLRELLAALLDLVGDPQQRQAALGRASPRCHSANAFVAASTAASTSAAPESAHLGDDLAGGRVAHLVRAVAAASERSCRR